MGAQLDTGGKGKKTATPVMNITPLIDVVLVLLIIFMVMTPLMGKTFSFMLPEVDESQAEESPPVQAPTDQPPAVALVLKVDKDGKIFLNGTEKKKEELIPTLEKAFKARDNTSLFFDADDRANYQAAAEAMDLARQAGATSIAIVTTDHREGQ